MKKTNYLGFGSPWATEIEELKYIFVKFSNKLNKLIHLSNETDHFVFPNGLSIFPISSDFKPKDF